MSSRITQRSLANTEQLVRLNHATNTSPLNKQPLFLLHSILGDPVQDFANLIPLLGNDIPMWGLRSKAHFDPTQPPDSIELMASSYINEIRRVQPEGPYTIAGLSAGGTIAWEMASQLESYKQHVTLILLGSTSPNIWRNLEGSLHTEAVYYLGYFLLTPELRLVDSILKNMRTSIEGITNNQAQISSLFVYLQSVVSDSQTFNNIQVAAYILNAIYNYHPKPIQSNIHIFKSSESFIPTDEKGGWEVDDYSTEVINGNHETFLTDPSLVFSLRKILGVAFATPISL